MPPTPPPSDVSDRERPITPDSSRTNPDTGVFENRKTSHPLGLFFSIPHCRTFWLRRASIQVDLSEREDRARPYVTLPPMAFVLHART
jgi:hypothetical protein